MRRVRAYSRDERKRLIIHALAEAIRIGDRSQMTCAEIAKTQGIVASTKLRQILAEMVDTGTLTITRQDDTGIAGYRYLYELNNNNDAFSVQHTNAKSARMQRIIRLNINGKVEALQLS